MRLRVLEASLCGDKHELDQSGVCSGKSVDSIAVRIYQILFQAAPVMYVILSEKLSDWRRQNEQQVYAVVKQRKDTGEIKENFGIRDVVFAYQAYIGQRTGELIMNNSEVDAKMEAKRLIYLLWYGVGKARHLLRHLYSPKSMSNRPCRQIRECYRIFIIYRLEYVHGLFDKERK